MPQLNPVTRLSLINVKLTESVPELKDVSFMRSPGVTDAGIKRLKEALPKAAIHRYSN